MKGKRRNHSTQFKIKVALAAVKGDKTLAELSKEFQLHPNQYNQLEKADDRIIAGGIFPAPRPSGPGPAGAGRQAVSADRSVEGRARLAQKKIWI